MIFFLISFPVVKKPNFYLKDFGFYQICLNYIRGHFSDVVKIPINLTCISDGLVAQLSGLYSVEDLDRLGDDPKDKV